MTTLRWIPVSLLAAVLVLAVACGGDDDDKGGDATGASTSPTASASTGASTGSSASATATSEPQSTGGTLDVGSVAASLEDVDSFRFNVNLKMNFDAPSGATGDDAAAAALFLALLGNIEMQGSYVAPDRMAMSATIFGTDMQTIQIGNESWTNDGTGWIAGTDPSAAGSSIPFDMGSPADLFDMIPQEQLAGAKTSSEKVNGVDTTRYHYDKDSLAELAATTGDGSGIGDLSEVDTLDLDIWITDDGLPVKMLMNVEGQSEGSQVSITLEFNVTDLNDPSITIEAPI